MVCRTTLAVQLTGVLASLGRVRAGKSIGADFGINGTQMAPSRLFFTAGATDGKVFSGKTEIAPKTWHHTALVRKGRRATVYLDGSPTPEIDVSIEVEVDPVRGPGWLSIGGRADDGTAFEGKIDEVALFDRELTSDEILAHVRAAEGTGRSER